MVTAESSDQKKALHVFNTLNCLEKMMGVMDSNQGLAPSCGG
jgi:hypothetical protein